ncbi:MAG: GntR family transcriptional regulator [Pseudomonadota bacterium]
MKNRSETLREAIEELILVGTFLPGQHLDETELAQRFGVSRTPIRETLIQLASLGIVVIRPRRGAVVAEFGAQQLVEMFEVMAELESLCARLAARRMSAQEHAELVAAHQQCRSARDAPEPDHYFYQNEQFHELIYRGSHNTFLCQQTSVMHRRLRPYRRLQLRVRDRIQRSYLEHEEVVQAILRGDEQAAAECMRGHIIVQGERFSDLIASLPHRASEAA